MPELAAFQDAFIASLTGDPLPGAPAGLAVYRNTVAQGLIEVLAAAYPTVHRLMGEVWFAAEALAFARAHPPASPVLALYGEGFAGWLAARADETMAYLPEVARLDRAWTEAHNAADAPVLTEPLFDATVRLHPAARLLSFDMPAVTLWRLNRPPAPVLAAEVAPDWRPEACLVSRPGDSVIVTDLDPETLTFLRVCLAGASLGEAAVERLQARPDADLADLFARLLTAGAFAEQTP